MRCCAPFCRNAPDNVPASQDRRRISFHGFPSDARLRAAWLRALGKQGVPLPEPAVVCSQHFLDDDIHETESGSRQIDAGVIPSTVLVCMICLETDSKMFLMSKRKLEKAYEYLTGCAPCNQGNLKQTLCVQCAQRLMNFSRFRDQSLRALALMIDLIGKHELITRQHIKMINRTKHRLMSPMVVTTLRSDFCDLHIQEDKSEDKHGESETTIDTGAVKTEKSDDPVVIGEDMDVVSDDARLKALQRKPENGDQVAKIQDLLKFEREDLECSLCSQEFDQVLAYMEHMSVHAQVCLMCLESDSKMFLMNKHKLEEAYELLTGYSPCNQGNLKQALCVQCAQRLMNFSRFRDQSLRARALMMDLVEKYELITRMHIKMIDRTKYRLKSSMVVTTLGADFCDLHIQEDTSDDKQTESETTIDTGAVKTEESDDSMVIEEEDMYVIIVGDNNADSANNHISEDNDNKEQISDSIMLDAKLIDEALLKKPAYVDDQLAEIQDPLKFESADFKCSLCSEEFVQELAYMEHMSAHAQNGSAAGESGTTGACERRADVGAGSSLPSLADIKIELVRINEFPDDRELEAPPMKKRRNCPPVETAVGVSSPPAPLLSEMVTTAVADPSEVGASSPVPPSPEMVCEVQEDDQISVPTPPPESEEFDFLLNNGSELDSDSGDEDLVCPFRIPRQQELWMDTPLDDEYDGGAEAAASAATTTASAATTTASAATTTASAATTTDSAATTTDSAATTTDSAATTTDSAATTTASAATTTDSAATTTDIAQEGQHDSAASVPVPVMGPNFYDFVWRALPDPPLDPELSERRELFSDNNVGPTTPCVVPYDIFTAIWDQTIMEHIVSETNKYAREQTALLRDKGILRPKSRLLEWRDTTVDEFYTYLAIVLGMACVVKPRIESYWAADSNIFCTPHFRAYMTLRRFQLLSRCLHFASNEVLNALDAGSPEANISKVKPVVDHLNEKFQQMYNLRQNIALDESLLQWKGWLSFSQLIPNKATGVKTYEICEPQTGYLWRFEVHSHKNSPNQLPLEAFTSTTVLRLLNGLENKGHTVWMNNFYNSPALARKLKTLGFDCVGTLRTNRQYVPEELSRLTKDRMHPGTITGFTSGDVDVMVWGDKYRVATISTYHGNEVTTKDGTTKPNLVLDYNTMMGGLDKKDQKLAAYPVERKQTRVWYKKIFHRLLNVSVLNAFLIYKQSSGRLRQYYFREALILSLLKRHARNQVVELTPKSDSVKYHHLDKLPFLPGKTQRQRRVCNICKKRVQTFCVGCDKFVCMTPCFVKLHGF